MCEEVRMKTRIHPYSCIFLQYIIYFVITTLVFVPNVISLSMRIILVWNELWLHNTQFKYVLFCILYYAFSNCRHRRDHMTRSRCQSSPESHTYVPGHCSYFDLPNTSGQPSVTTHGRRAHISCPTADNFSKHDTLHPLHEIPTFS